jgi:hypothetical protein
VINSPTCDVSTTSAAVLLLVPQSGAHPLEAFEEALSSRIGDSDQKSPTAIMRRISPYVLTLKEPPSPAAPDVRGGAPSKRSDGAAAEEGSTKHGGEGADSMGARERLERRRAQARSSTPVEGVDAQKHSEL